MREKLTRGQILTDSQERGAKDPAELFEETCGDLTLKNMSDIEKQTGDKIMKTAKEFVEARAKGNKAAQEAAKKVMQETIEGAAKRMSEEKEKGEKAAQKRIGDVMQEAIEAAEKKKGE